MTEPKRPYEIALDTLFERAQFCLICGQKLVLVDRPRKTGIKTVVMEKYKLCPDMHGSVAEPTGEYGYNLYFTVTREYRRTLRS